MAVNTTISKTVLFAVCALLVGGGPAPAQSAATAAIVHELRLGVLAHDMPWLWSGFQLERGVDFNAELILSPSVRFLGGYIRPAIGGSLSSSGQTSRGYIDARWQYETTSGVFFGLGLGAALHNGTLNPTEVDRKALGSRVLFHIPIEIGYRFDRHNSVSVYFEHVSNGYTQSFNEGLDGLGVRYGYKF
jgi:lipid A 3-O-deacylase